MGSLFLQVLKFGIEEFHYRVIQVLETLWTHAREVLSQQTRQRGLASVD